MTGNVLGYLINNFLIDSRQYEAWRGLEPSELKKELSKAGILSEAEYDEFSQQVDGSCSVDNVQG
ncbi:MAG: hypothetical protein H6Q72_787 [Firmicutes bacterium]|nr:hypothetical protein [Bacillota bacterium]